MHVCGVLAFNNALIDDYAFAGSSKGALLIHASAIKYGDDGIAYSKSGTGKSTHTGCGLNTYLILNY